MDWLILRSLCVSWRGNIQLTDSFLYMHVYVYIYIDEWDLTRRDLSLSNTLMLYISFFCLLFVGTWLVREHNSLYMSVHVKRLYIFYCFFFPLHLLIASNLMQSNEKWKDNQIVSRLLSIFWFIYYQRERETHTYVQCECIYTHEIKSKSCQLALHLNAQIKYWPQ